MKIKFNYFNYVGGSFYEGVDDIKIFNNYLSERIAFFSNKKEVYSKAIIFLWQDWELIKRVEGQLHKEVAEIINIDEIIKKAIFISSPRLFERGISLSDLLQTYQDMEFKTSYSIRGGKVYLLGFTPLLAEPIFYLPKAGWIAIYKAGRKPFRLLPY